MIHRIADRTRLIVLITALAAAMIVTPFVIAPSTDDQSYEAAVEAAARGDWPEALRWLSVLAGRDPHFRDVDQRLREAARGTAARMADLDPLVEADVVGYLAAVDAGALADALDGCMTSIRAGAFVMDSGDGRTDEVPERTVRLSEFSIDRFEITNAQYQRYLRATGALGPPYWTGIEYPPGQADRPVVGVSWSDANDSAPGRGSDCRPRPNGNERAAARTAGLTHGATSGAPISSMSRRA
jgi:formylglycine-generating enzyme required for sulfatase activity